MKQPSRFGVLGSGPVGQTLARGLKKHGYEVRIGTRTPGKLAAFTKETGIAEGSFAEVSAWAEAVVLAVAGTAALEALALAGAGHLTGKAVLDTTNPIAKEPPEDGVLRLFTGPNESLMERLQAAHPKAMFVKVFSIVGNSLMVDPQIPSGKPTMFYCGNDASAKAITARLLEQFGWESEDMGTVKAARAIEPLCILWCIPGFLRNDWVHAFRMVRP
ncbi:MAG: NAD(P)-binding domain-containing protein [Gemmatimonadales bacterium]